MFRVIRNILLFAIAAVLLVALALYLALLLINWSDETYSDDAHYFQQIWSERQGAFDQNNAYVGIMGLDAAEPLSMWEAGLLVITDQRKCATAVEQDCDTLYEAQELSESAIEFFRMCERDWVHCRIESQQLSPERVLAESRWLTERYQKLLKLSNYKSAIPPLQQAMPNMALLLKAQRLNLLKIFYKNREQAKPYLAEDLAFWRMLLRECDSLICKMIAATGIQNHFGMSGIYLSNVPLQARQKMTPDNWYQPITRDEFGFERVYAGEFQYMTRFVDQSPPSYDAIEPAWLGKLARTLMPNLYQPVATLNLQARLYREALSAAELPYWDMWEDHNEHDGRAPDYITSGVVWYNPVGNVLMQIAAAGSYRDYVYRVASLEGVRQMTLLITELDASAPLGPQFSASDYSNPFTGRRFRFMDSGDALIFFPVGHGHAYQLPLPEPKGNVEKSGLQRIL